VYNHSVEKPIKCEHCDSRLKQKANLNRLMTNMHERPQECDKCVYRAKNKSDLTGHKRTHSAVRSWECDYAAKTKTELKGHKLSHSGKRPFICDHCDYAAKSTCALNKHVRGIHNIIIKTLEIVLNVLDRLG
jgi:KRAB domain-containing zinc finger protein